ncbi:MAG: hypothetical protein ACHP8A_12905 [Terriglobales bacterium]|jgi:hypothetical protein
MWSATILIVCLQLGTAATGLPSQSLDIVATLQTTSSPAEQNSQPASSVSPGSTPQTKSQQPSPSPTKKKAVTPPVRKKARRKAHSKPGKVVVRNGSTSDPSVEFSTTASPEQATHERQNTAGLLAATEANLQKVSGHPLNSTQQDMVKQIRGYMQQAKSAGDAGDLQSAQNLALKAQLLSSELVRK